MSWYVEIDEEKEKRLEKLQDETSARIKSYNDFTEEELRIYGIAYREITSWYNCITEIEEWDDILYTEAICYYLPAIERLDLYEAIPRILKQELEEELREYKEDENNDNDWWA